MIQHEELKEMLYKPAKDTIAYLEQHRELLSTDELVILEKLKCSIKIFEIEKSAKDGK